MTLHLGDAQQTTVTIRKTPSDSPLQGKKYRVTWNGKPLPNYQISVKELKKGGELVFSF